MTRTERRRLTLPRAERRRLALMLAWSVLALVVLVDVILVASWRYTAVIVLAWIGGIISLALHQDFVRFREARR